MELRTAVHRLYAQVKAKIKTMDELSKCFGSNIGVKQGCPLSPTLFGFYIDKLEKWLNMASGEGVQLANYVIRLLLYENDLIIITKTTNDLRKHLKELECFCQ